MSPLVITLITAMVQEAPQIETLAGSLLALLNKQALSPEQLAAIGQAMVNAHNREQGASA